MHPWRASLPRSRRSASMRPRSAPAPRPKQPCSSISRSFTIGSACTRPWDTEPRPRLAPAWRRSPCERQPDILISPLHTKGGGPVLADTRTGQNSRHTLIAQLRQSVFGRLAGYEDVNDADRLGRDPAMRWIVGGRAVTQSAASASQMGRFETEVLVQEANLSARWIDLVHGRRPVKGIVLDMASSVSPTFGEQEGTAYNGHFGCPCYHPLFVFNQFGDLDQFGDLERCALRPGNV